MIECNCMIPVMNYGSSASYKAEPSPEQIATGVIPLDSLPAAWWNCMWSQTNTAVNQARQELGQLIVELNNVLCNAGVCPQDVCTDQLYQSIEKIRQTLGNATTAGAVKSSSQPSEVAIDQTTGMMSVNCLGNAASLTTSARTVVGAVNELKSTYDQCFTDTGTALSGKAPTSHVSDATTYGVGNADCYGHLKISDTYTCDLGCTGMAASQTALYCVYDFAAGIAAGVASLGNTAGCALGTASAGTAVTAARSDHVHPVPSRVALADTVTVNYENAYNGDFSLALLASNPRNCIYQDSNSTYHATFNPATGVLKIPGGGIGDATNQACKVTFNYGGAGISNPVWLAGWNGYELRAVCRANLCVACACLAYNGAPLGPSASNYTPSNYSDGYVRVAYCSSCNGGCLSITNCSTLYALIVSVTNGMNSHQACILPACLTATFYCMGCTSSTRKLLITRQ